jgi:AraC-like DNA-binding protein
MAWARRTQAVATASRERRAAARDAWPLSPGALTGAAAENRRLGELTVLEIGAPSAVRWRAPAQAQGRSQQLLLITLIAGEASFRTWDDHARGIPLSGVLALGSQFALEMRLEAGARMVGVVVPAHLITPRFVALERLAGGALRAHCGGVAVLLHQLIAGLGGGAVGFPAAGPLADAIGGLLAVVLEDCWSAPADESGATRRERIEAIGAHLRRHFADPELTPGRAAQALGLSRRYVHKLYAGEGRSFRQELISLRIEACLRAFAEDRSAAKTIADIAYAAGYTDISQFNRHFRRVMGATPTAIRRAMLEKARPAAPRAKPRLGLVAGG